MPDNLFFIQIMIREKQKWMTEEAQRRHLIARSNRSSPPVKTRVCIFGEELLISAGAWLKARYTPALAEQAVAGVDHQG